MNNPFEGKAVRFETSEQLDHLAELASWYGLEVKNVSIYSVGHRYFRAVSTNAYYSDFNNNYNLPEIHYYQFVADIYVQKFVDSRNPKSDTPNPDMVNHPPHYTVNGIEVIDVIENYKLNYRLGNVVKYVLRSDLKGNRLQDLKKALWYLQREIEQSEKQTPCTNTQ